MRFDPFEPSHAVGATAHPSQAHYQHLLDDPENFRALWPETLSAIDGGELAAIGGSALIGDFSTG